MANYFKPNNNLTEQYINTNDNGHVISKDIYYCNASNVRDMDLNLRLAFFCTALTFTGSGSAAGKSVQEALPDMQDSLFQN